MHGMTGIYSLVTEQSNRFLRSLSLVDVTPTFLIVSLVLRLRCRMPKHHLSIFISVTLNVFHHFWPWANFRGDTLQLNELPCGRYLISVSTESLRYTELQTTSAISTMPCWLSSWHPFEAFFTCGIAPQISEACHFSLLFINVHGKACLGTQLHVFGFLNIRLRLYLRPYEWLGDDCIIGSCKLTRWLISPIKILIQYVYREFILPECS